MIRLIIAGALLCLFSFNAEARQRHHAATGLHPDCNILFPCQAPSESSPQTRRETRGRYVARSLGFGGPVPQRAVRVPKARQNTSKEIGFQPNEYGHKSPVWASKGITPAFVSSIGRPVRYIAGRLICAVNVGVALAERGIKGTGSALALSYLHWGRSAGGPVPGAVIVSSRRGGGHVAIVSRVENGVVYAWNATGGQSGWREIPYRHAVLDYRVPG